jgi:hypothetical protein
VVVWLVAGQATRLTTLRPGLFTPLIAMAALVGAYTIKLEILDVALTVVFGYVGYAMSRYGFSRVALIIALVLGELVERSHYQTVKAFGGAGAMFTRPISGLLMALSILVVAYAVLRAVRRRGASAGPAGDGEEDVPDGPGFPWGRIVFDGLLLAFAVTLVAAAFSITTDAATMPLLIGIPVLTGLVLLLLRDLMPAFARRRPSGAGGGDRDGHGPASPAPATTPARSKTGVETLEVVATAEPASAGPPHGGLLRRQTAFGLWAVGFVLVSALAGFVVSIPVALLFFLRVLARESWRLSILVASGGWLFLYGLFALALGVPL